MPLRRCQAAVQFVLGPADALTTHITTVVTLEPCREGRQKGMGGGLTQKTRGARSSEVEAAASGYKRHTSNVLAQTAWPNRKRCRNGSSKAAKKATDPGLGVRRQRRGWRRDVEGRGRGDDRVHQPLVAGKCLTQRLSCQTKNNTPDMSRRVHPRAKCAGAFGGGQPPAAHAPHASMHKPSRQNKTKAHRPAPGCRRRAPTARPTASRCTSAAGLCRSQSRKRLGSSQ